MAIIESKYRAPFLYRNKHVATVIPSMYRKLELAYDQRERLELSDGDFVDIDWLGKGREQVIVLTHGLEGNSQRHYITSIADQFYKQGWGVAAWNCRSCSDEMNHLPRLYSHIDAPDLAEVIDHVAPDCSRLAIAGISMGGAITLNYMSKIPERHPDNLIGAVAISAPTDVFAGSKWLDRPGNKFYRKRFLTKMLKRAALKETQFPGIIDLSKLESIKTFEDYDKNYTTAMTGCASLEEFYERANSIEHLDKINRPTLLLISGDDPFMSETCYPYDAASEHANFHLEVTKHGGHTGFIMKDLRHSWMEKRTYEFINNLR